MHRLPTLSTEPSPTMNRPSPDAEEPGSAMDSSCSAADSTSHTVDSASPVVEEPGLAMDSSSPAAEEPGLAMDCSCSAADSTSHTVDSASPVVEEPSLAMDSSSPAAEEPGPAMEGPRLSGKELMEEQAQLPQETLQPTPSGDELVNAIIECETIEAQNRYIDDLIASLTTVDSHQNIFYIRNNLWKHNAKKEIFLTRYIGYILALKDKEIELRHISFMKIFDPRATYRMLIRLIDGDQIAKYFFCIDFFYDHLNTQDRIKISRHLHETIMRKYKRLFSNTSHSLWNELLQVTSKFTEFLLLKCTDKSTQPVTEELIAEILWNSFRISRLLDTEGLRDLSTDNLRLRKMIEQNTMISNDNLIFWLAIVNQSKRDASTTQLILTQKPMTHSFMTDSASMTRFLQFLIKKNNTFILTQTLHSIRSGEYVEPDFQLVIKTIINDSKIEHYKIMLEIMLHLNDFDNFLPTLNELCNASKVRMFDLIIQKTRVLDHRPNLYGILEHLIKNNKTAMISRVMNLIPSLHRPENFFSIVKKYLGSVPEAYVTAFPALALEDIYNRYQLKLAEAAQMSDQRTATQEQGDSDDMDEEPAPTPGQAPSGDLVDESAATLWADDLDTQEIGNWDDLSSAFASLVEQTTPDAMEDVPPALPWQADMAKIDPACKQLAENIKTISNKYKSEKQRFEFYLDRYNIPSCRMICITLCSMMLDRDSTTLDPELADTVTNHLLTYPAEALDSTNHIVRGKLLSILKKLPPANIQEICEDDDWFIKFNFVFNDFVAYLCRNKAIETLQIIYLNSTNLLQVALFNQVEKNLRTSEDYQILRWSIKARKYEYNINNLLKILSVTPSLIVDELFVDYPIFCHENYLALLESEIEKQQDRTEASKQLETCRAIRREHDPASEAKMKQIIEFFVEHDSNGMESFCGDQLEDIFTFFPFLSLNESIMTMISQSNKLAKIYISLVDKADFTQLNKANLVAGKEAMSYFKILCQAGLFHESEELVEQNIKQQSMSGDNIQNVLSEWFMRGHFNEANEKYLKSIPIENKVILLTSITVNSCHDSAARFNYLNKKIQELSLKDAQIESIMARCIFGRSVAVLQEMTRQYPQRDHTKLLFNAMLMSCDGYAERAIGNQALFFRQEICNSDAYGYLKSPEWCYLYLSFVVDKIRQDMVGDTAGHFKELKRKINDKDLFTYLGNIDPVMRAACEPTKEKCVDNFLLLGSKKDQYLHLYFNSMIGEDDELYADRIKLALIDSIRKCASDPLRITLKSLVKIIGTKHESFITQHYVSGLIQYGINSNLKDYIKYGFKLSQIIEHLKIAVVYKNKSFVDDNLNLMDKSKDLVDFIKHLIIEENEEFVLRLLDQYRYLTLPPFIFDFLELCQNTEFHQLSNTLLSKYKHLLIPIFFNSAARHVGFTNINETFYEQTTTTSEAQQGILADITSHLCQIDDASSHAFFEWLRENDLCHVYIDQLIVNEQQLPLLVELVKTQRTIIPVNLLLDRAVRSLSKDQFNLFLTKLDLTANELFDLKLLNRILNYDYVAVKAILLEDDNKALRLPNSINHIMKLVASYHFFDKTLQFCIKRWLLHMNIFLEAAEYNKSELDDYGNESISSSLDQLYVLVHDLKKNQHTLDNESRIKLYSFYHDYCHKKNQLLKEALLRIAAYNSQLVVKWLKLERGLVCDEVLSKVLFERLLISFENFIELSEEFNCRVNLIHGVIMNVTPYINDPEIILKIFKNYQILFSEKDFVNLIHKRIKMKGRDSESDLILIKLKELHQLKAHSNLEKEALLDSSAHSPDTIDFSLLTEKGYNKESLLKVCLKIIMHHQSIYPRITTGMILEKTGCKEGCLAYLVKSGYITLLPEKVQIEPSFYDMFNDSKEQLNCVKSLLRYTQQGDEATATKILLDIVKLDFKGLSAEEISIIIKEKTKIKINIEDISFILRDHMGLAKVSIGLAIKLMPEGRYAVSLQDAAALSLTSFKKIETSNNKLISAVEERFIKDLNIKQCLQSDSTSQYLKKYGVLRVLVSCDALFNFFKVHILAFKRSLSASQLSKVYSALTAHIAKYNLSLTKILPHHFQHCDFANFVFALNPSWEIPPTHDEICLPDKLVQILIKEVITKQFKVNEERLVFTGQQLPLYYLALTDKGDFILYSYLITLSSYHSHGEKYFFKMEPCDSRCFATVNAAKKHIAELNNTHVFLSDASTTLTPKQFEFNIGWTHKMPGSKIARGAFWEDFTIATPKKKNGPPQLLKDTESSTEISLNKALIMHQEYSNATGLHASFEDERVEEYFLRLNLVNITLRANQKRAFKQVLSCINFGFNGAINNLPVGAGKTLATCSLLGFLYNDGLLPGTVLVLTPKNVIGNWKEEFEKIYAIFPLLRDKIFITNIQAIYEQLDCNQLTPSALVLDEAHHFVSGEHLKKLAFIMKHPNCKYILPLTATPICNSPQELLDMINVCLYQCSPLSRRFGSRTLETLGKYINYEKQLGCVLKIITQPSKAEKLKTKLDQLRTHMKRTNKALMALIRICLPDSGQSENSCDAKSQDGKRDSWDLTLSYKQNESSSAHSLADQTKHNCNGLFFTYFGNKERESIHPVLCGVDNKMTEKALTKVIETSDFFDHTTDINSFINQSPKLRAFIDWYTQQLSTQIYPIGIHCREVNMVRLLKFILTNKFPYLKTLSVTGSDSNDSIVKSINHFNGLITCANLEHACPDTLLLSDSLKILTQLEFIRPVDESKSGYTIGKDLWGKFNAAWRDAEESMKFSTLQATQKLDIFIQSFSSNYNPMALKRASRDILSLIIETSRSIILLFTDCCCEGVNLNGAHTILSMSNHWNPKQQIQVFGRANRPNDQVENGFFKTWHINSPSLRVQFCGGSWDIFMKQFKLIKQKYIDFYIGQRLCFNDFLTQVMIFHLNKLNLLGKLPPIPDAIYDTVFELYKDDVSMELIQSDSLDHSISSSLVKLIICIFQRSIDSIKEDDIQDELHQLTHIEKVIPFKNAASLGSEAQLQEFLLNLLETIKDYSLSFSCMSDVKNRLFSLLSSFPDWMKSERTSAIVKSIFLWLDNKSLLLEETFALNTCKESLNKQRLSLIILRISVGELSDAKKLITLMQDRYSHTLTSAEQRHFAEIKSQIANFTADPELISGLHSTSWQLTPGGYHDIFQWFSEFLWQYLGCSPSADEIILCLHQAHVFEVSSLSDKKEICDYFREYFSSTDFRARHLPAALRKACAKKMATLFDTNEQTFKHRFIDQIKADFMLFLKRDGDFSHPVSEITNQFNQISVATLDKPYAMYAIDTSDTSDTSNALLKKAMSELESWLCKEGFPYYLEAIKKSVILNSELELETLGSMTNIWFHIYNTQGSYVKKLYYANDEVFLTAYYCFSLFSSNFIYSSLSEPCRVILPQAYNHPASSSDHAMIDEQTRPVSISLQGAARLKRPIPVEDIKPQAIVKPKLARTDAHSTRGRSGGGSRGRGKGKGRGRGSKNKWGRPTSSDSSEEDTDEVLPQSKRMRPQRNTVTCDSNCTPTDLTCSPTYSTVDQSVGSENSCYFFVKYYEIFFQGRPDQSHDKLIELFCNCINLAFRTKFSCFNPAIINTYSLALHNLHIYQLILHWGSRAYTAIELFETQLQKQRKPSNLNVVTIAGSLIDRSLIDAGSTLLHVAVRLLNEPAVHWLVDEKRLDVNTQNDNGETAMYALTVFAGHLTEERLAGLLTEERLLLALNLIYYLSEKCDIFKQDAPDKAPLKNLVTNLLAKNGELGPLQDICSVVNGNRVRDRPCSSLLAP